MLSDEDGWRCDAPGDLATLWVRTTRMAAPDGVPADAAEVAAMAASAATDTVQRWRREDVLGTVAERTLDGARLVSASIDHGGGDGGDISHRWNLFVPLPRACHIATFSLVVVRGRAEEPDIAALRPLFDRQIERLARDRRWIAGAPRPASASRAGSESGQAVHLHGFGTVRVPEGWRFERADDGEWWCGDEAHGVSLFLRAEDVSPRDGADTSSRTERAAPAIAQVEAFFRENAVDGRVERHDRPDGAVLHAIIDHEEHGAPFRSFRWYRVKAFGDGAVVLTRWTLVMPRPLAETSAGRALVELVGEQARRLEITRPTAPELLYEPLAEHSFGGHVRLRIPRAWIVTERDEGLWLCQHESAAPGRLWVLCRAFELASAPPEREEAGPLLERLLCDFAEPDENTRRLREETLPGNGMLVGYTVDEDEGPLEEPGAEPLRYHSWHCVRLIPPRDVALVRFRLTLPLQEADSPEAATLVAILRREIPAADIADPA